MEFERVYFRVYQTLASSEIMKGFKGLSYPFLFLGVWFIILTIYLHSKYSHGTGLIKQHLIEYQQNHGVDFFPDFGLENMDGDLNKAKNSSLIFQDILKEKNGLQSSARVVLKRKNIMQMLLLGEIRKDQALQIIENILENEKNELLDLKKNILKLRFPRNESTSDNSEELIEVFNRYLDNKGSKIEDSKHFEILVKRFKISPLKLAQFLSFNNNTLKYRYNNTNYMIGRNERPGIYKTGDVFNFKFYLEKPSKKDILSSQNYPQNYTENERVTIKEFEFSNIPHAVEYSGDNKYNNTMLKPNVHYFNVKINDLTKGQVIPIIGTRDTIFVLELMNIFK